MMTLPYTTLLAYIVSVFALVNSGYYGTYFNDPDVGRTTTEFIESRHFECELHYITTSDGYILDAYRIKNPFNENDDPYPILFTTSTALDVNQWLWNYGGNAETPKDPSRLAGGSVLNSNLPYALANHGYDVWLFNTRGVGDHLNHTRLSPAESDYWKFSLDQPGQIDIPSAIEYVRSYTKHEKVGMVGYSQGSLFMLMAMSTFPKYNDIIKPAILFGFGIVQSKPIGILSVLTDTVSEVLAALPGPFFPKSKLTSTALTVLCGPPLTPVCTYVILQFVGNDPDNVNQTRIPVYTSQFPAGTSTWCGSQFLRSLKYDVFPMFDYGKTKNLDKYGTQSPPFYNFTMITNRFIGAFIGRNDMFTSYDNALHVLDLLGVDPIFEKYVIPYEKWNHVDFILGKSLGRYLVPKVIMTISKALSSE
ncbi:Lipase member N [Halotydeus destructor]|nr:Lipase member N [Halotydeus destructor]